MSVSIADAYAMAERAAAAAAEANGRARHAHEVARGADNRSMQAHHAAAAAEAHWAGTVDDIRAIRSDIRELKEYRRKTDSMSTEVTKLMSADERRQHRWRIVGHFVKRSAGRAADRVVMIVVAFAALWAMQHCGKSWAPALTPPVEVSP